MKVIRSKIGFCVGIVNSYKRMNQLAGEEKSLHLAHQDSSGAWDVLKRIERKDPRLLERYPNLDSVTIVGNPAELKAGDRLALGFHGFPPEVQNELKTKGVNILKDFQCPFIATLNRQAEGLARDGYDLLVMGIKGTHHVTDAIQLAAKHKKSCTVLEKADDVDQIVVEEGQKLALIGQVTGNTETWVKVVDRVRQLQLPVKIVETLCSDSYDRQDEARRIAKEADVVILLADPGRSTFDVASNVNGNIHRIDRKEDIRSEWFEKAQTVGLISGIAVPEWTLDEVTQYIEEITV